MKALTRSVVLPCLVLSLLFGAAGCGGGGDAPPVSITIISCDAVTFASAGVVCVEFQIQGLQRGTANVLAQFAVGPGAPLEDAREIPPALEAQLGVTSSSTGVIGSKGSVPVKFYWFAGSDLGFVAAGGIQFFLTAVAPGSGQTLGSTAQCGPIFYPGGGQTQLGSGPGIGNLGGRSQHCAEYVGGKSIAIAGGTAGTSVYDTFDRFTFNTDAFTFTNSLPFLMQNPRVNHACSFFLDPNTGALKVLATGGVQTLPSTSPSATADVYCFTPTEQVMPTAGSMNVARLDHTATWIPSNKVVVIGGSNGTNVLCSIELWDPLLGTFQLLPSSLTFCRSQHTATLLPSGKILVAGGVGTAGATALAAELFDPATGVVMTVPGPVVDRVSHTATRLANGWVLLAGGSLVTSMSTVSSSAQIFQPELGVMGQFTSTVPLMSSPRTMHAASLLGDGHVLLTGGQTASGCNVVTQSAEIFLPEILTFTPTIPMLIARAGHSSTATNCGAVEVIGGQNDINCSMTFLNSVEIYPFSNQNPVITFASVGAAAPSHATISIGVTDADADGGYVIIRYRVGGIGMFMLAHITQQTPSTALGNFPSMFVSGLPGLPVPYSFLWDFGSDGLVTGQTVEVEVLPVGATIGDPVRFTTILP